MQSIVEISGEDVGRDSGAQLRGVIIDGSDYSVIEVVASKGFDGSLIEDQPGEASIVDLDITAG